MCITKVTPHLIQSGIGSGVVDNSCFSINCNNTNSTWQQLELDTDNNFHAIPVIAGTMASIDVSKYNFPNEIWYRIPDGEWVLKVVTYVPVILFGLIGNALLITIILRNRYLRTPTNLLIANMATADFATLLICPIMVMYRDFFQNYLLGPVGCKMEGFLQASLLVTAVLSLSAVSYDRLTAIVLPLETRLTIKGAKLVMAATWILGAVLSIPLIIFRNYRERQWKNFLETYCSENISILPMYWHVIISAIVWFPLCVMVLCYSAIFWKLDRYEQKVLRRENPISVCYKTKVAKMMFTVLIIFVLFRVPFTALIFIRNQMLKDTKVNQVQGAFTILWYCSHYLMFCNAAINPIIYGLTNDKFRKAYRQTPLIKLFCKSAGLEPNNSRARQQRINNMLLGQSAEESKAKKAKGSAGQVEGSPETSSSDIYNTRKTTTRVQVISTNLSDSAIDPGDYHIMENSESQVEPVEGAENNNLNRRSSAKDQPVGAENFI